MISVSASVFFDMLEGRQTMTLASNPYSHENGKIVLVNVRSEISSRGYIRRAKVGQEFWTIYPEEVLNLWLK